MSDGFALRRTSALTVSCKCLIVHVYLIPAVRLLYLSQAPNWCQWVAEHRTNLQNIWTSITKLQTLTFNKREGEESIYTVDDTQCVLEFQNLSWSLFHLLYMSHEWMCLCVRMHVCASIIIDVIILWK